MKRFNCISTCSLDPQIRGVISAIAIADSVGLHKAYTKM